HTNQLSAAGQFDVQKFLPPQHKGMLLVHRRDVIKPIEIADRLQKGFFLDQLFIAAMEQAHVRIDTVHDLAVEVQYEAQCPMVRWVLRSKIDRECPACSFGHRGLNSCKGNSRSYRGFRCYRKAENWPPYSIGGHDDRSVIKAS